MCHYNLFNQPCQHFVQYREQQRAVIARWIIICNMQIM